MARKRLSHQPAENRLLDGLAIYFGDGLRQRNIFRANLNTILRVGAIGYTSRTHHGFEAFPRVHGAGRMHVEQADLADDRGADELVVFVHLRTDLQAIAAGDATRERIGLGLQVGRHSRAFSEIVRAVNRNPGLHALQVLKHYGAVHGEVPYNRKLRHWLEADGFVVRIHHRLAAHPRLAIDHHAAASPYFLVA